jgi:hypothetical protein
LLRYIEVLMIVPWKVDVGKENGYPFSPKRKVQIANPATGAIDSYSRRAEPRDRAKDLLYIRDTIEVFSDSLEELQKIFGQEVAPKLHPRRRAALEGAADRLFGKMDDTIRQAAVMAVGRKLTAERLAETSQAGLKEIFTRR